MRMNKIIWQELKDEGEKAESQRRLAFLEEVKGLKTIEIMSITAVDCSNLKQLA